ncbi:MAG: galactose mutarotase [Bacillales bacterium]|nr:galactose mutarotase [Bacillales bacterium]
MEIKKYQLANEFMTVTFLDLGATIYKWEVNSLKRNIVLTNQDLSAYIDGSNTGFYGQTIGRVGNRIKDGKFSVNGIEYQTSKNYLHKHSLHGGNKGFWSQIFKVKEEKDTLIFTYFSADKEEGYPGNLTLDVIYKLEGNTLLINYKATTDKATPLNITNHSYFRLSNNGNILNDYLTISADKILEVDNELIPTGNFLDVKNTPFDFNKPRQLKDSLTLLKDTLNKGIDNHFVFTKPFLNLSSEDLSLDITTSYPGVQIYSHNFTTPQLLDGNLKMQQHHGIAIEPQFEIDSINQTYRDIILKPKQEYNEWIKYKLTLK